MPPALGQLCFVGRPRLKICFAAEVLEPAFAYRLVGQVVSTEVRAAIESTDAADPLRSHWRRPVSGVHNEEADTIEDRDGEDGGGDFDKFT